MSLVLSGIGKSHPIEWSLYFHFFILFFILFISL
jgi:hypothetical protein